MKVQRKGRVVLLVTLFVACARGDRPPTAPSPDTDPDATDLIAFPDSAFHAPAPPSVLDSLRRAELVALHELPLATYDGSNESTHPDVLCFDQPWGGWKCWMVVTPYPGSKVQFENPSLAVSNDREHWIPAPGIPTPLIPRPVSGYNSDPELSFDPVRGCLSVLFREVDTDNVIKSVRSCDGGQNWDVPHKVFALPNHQAISPTIAEGPDHLQRLWYVDANKQGCGTQASKVRMRMLPADSISTRLGVPDISAVVAKNLVWSQPGYVIWHIKVRYVPEKQRYWALYAAYPVGSSHGCADDDLFFASSKDGIRWQTYPVPVLNHLDARFNFSTFYRATFLYDALADAIQIFVPGIASGKWAQYGITLRSNKLEAALQLALITPHSALKTRANILLRPDTLHANPLHFEDH